MPPRAPISSPPPDSPVSARILHQARTLLFAHGYSAFTMSDLAAELGMSKKTLYVHFPGKDELLRAVIDELGAEIRAEADALVRDKSLNFSGKIRAFAEGMVRRLAPITPRMIRDLERHAPALHQRMAEVRGKNIPYVFGRFIEEGQHAGLVARDLDVRFATEFLLQALNGLLQFSELEQIQLAPRDVLPRALDLFFLGLLTSAGRKEHEKLHPR